MQSYYISSSNSLMVRTEDTASLSNGSGSYHFEYDLYDLTLHTTHSLTISGSFNPYENVLQFTASVLDGIVEVGSEYLTKIYAVSGSIRNEVFRGSLQVYSQQDIDKTQYQSQNTSGSYISHTSSNEYIIM